MAYEPLFGPNEEVIHSGNVDKYIDPHVNGEQKKRGLIPRNYATHPQGCYAGMPAWGVDMPTIPRSEWPHLIKEMTESKSRLSDIRMKGNNGHMIPSRDQNGKPYCWMHSGVAGVIYLRAKFMLPYVSLSAYAGACIIKDYADEGGWGAQGVDFLRERGIPSEEFWPQKSMSHGNDNPQTWANAALHKVTDGWYDLHAAQYDRKLTFDQVMTCLLNRIPVVGDFNWWGHSVCIIDPVDGAATWGRMRAASGKMMDLAEFNKVWDMDDVDGGFGNRIQNSWGDDWSDNGTGVLAGGKAVPDGAVAPYGVLASAL